MRKCIFNSQSKLRIMILNDELEVIGMYMYGLDNCASLNCHHIPMPSG